MANIKERRALLKLALEAIEIAKTPSARRKLQNVEPALFTIERKFIKQAIKAKNNQSILNNKFSDLKVNNSKIINELSEAIYLLLKEAFNNVIQGNKSIYWLPKSNKTVIQADSTYILEKALTKVKKIISQNARNEYERSKNIINKRSKELTETGVQNIASIIVSGIDVRNYKEGGDVKVTKNLKKGKLVFDKGDKKSGFGIHIAHAFGPGLVDIYAVTGGEENKFSSLFSPNIQMQLIGERNAAIKVDGDYNENLRLFEKSGRQSEITVTLLMEGKENLKGGGDVSPYVLRVLQLAEENLIKKFSKTKTYGDLFTAKGSPSLEDMYADGLIQLFLQGKISKPKVSKNNKKGTKILPVKLPIYSPAFLANPVLKIKPTKNKPEEQTIDLNSKIPYLNRRLHDKIQQNMGKGNAKQILNYRTGRFARSAEIQSFSPSREKGAVNAIVRYMRYPYGTFEPGGRLHRPGRDPHRIFARSIRQLLQEEKLATLRRVKVELRG